MVKEEGIEGLREERGEERTRERKQRRGVVCEKQ